MTEDRDHCGWWWLSFCDQQRPKGSQFLGVAIVHADGLMDAMQEARRRGCNPGGEVMAFPATNLVPKTQWRNRLLTHKEAECADEDTESIGESG